MKQTEDVKELVTALSKAQGQMKPAVFNKVNPHFKNRYADFKSCMDACRSPLSDNGLSVMQYCDTVNDKLVLVTMLSHSSGQWIKSYFPLNPKNMDSQSIGSALSYAKRYSLCAKLGIVSDDDDDDAEIAQGRVQTIAPPSNGDANKKISDPQISILRAMGQKLKGECAEKIWNRIKTEIEVDKLEDISIDNYKKVFSILEAGVKFMESQNKGNGNA